MAGKEALYVLDSKSNYSSGTAPTTDNRVTLYTCVMNQPEYRWKVTAVEG